MVIVFGLTSIVFFSMMLLGVALFMRKQWDGLANSTPPRPKRHDSKAR
jgi:hypothetical protein